MRLLIVLTLVVNLAAAANLYGQEKTRQKPYILELSGGCYPHETSIEYFITGAFGGYVSFVKTDPRFFRYEIPTVRDGKPARSMKIMVRSARCRTVTIDIPEVEEGGRLVRARLRRSRGLELRGKIVSPEVLSLKDARITVEYWADWKCEFIGVSDCLIGPIRIDAVDLKRDGRFRLRVPDQLSDPALAPFLNKGSFRFFIRERYTGRVLFDLRPLDGSSPSITVSQDYPSEMDFVAESETNPSIPEIEKLF